MGEIIKADILADLQRQNPRARPSDLVIYADALVEYRKAQENIDEHGSIVFHPRTGSPIDNPYVRVRDRASALIRRMSKIKADGMWIESQGGQ